MKTIHFFSTRAKLRAWFIKNHERLDEAWIGYYKKGSGIPSITWQESVEEALCFGWIDGIRKSHDAVSYMNRFTPRRQKSNWSATNLATMRRLIRAGLVFPKGDAIYRARQKKAAPYSFEQRIVRLSPDLLRVLKNNAAAWKFFGSMSPSYRRTASWWVMSAKQRSTREKRLEILIASSAQRKPIPLLRYSYSKGTVQ